MFDVNYVESDIADVYPRTESKYSFIFTLIIT